MGSLLGDNARTCCDEIAPFAREGTTTKDLKKEKHPKAEVLCKYGMVDKDEPTPDTREQEPRVLWDPMNGAAGRETPLEEVAVMVSSASAASETAFCPKTQRKGDDELECRSHLDCVRLEKPHSRQTQQGWGLK